MSETTVHAYHYRPDHPLAAVSAERWWSFCNGNQPLEPSVHDKTKGVHRVLFLLVTMRQQQCETIEPIAIEVDSDGFLQRKDIALRQLGLGTATDPSKAGSARVVVDLRPRFIERYLRHSHQWQPSAETLFEAMDDVASTQATAREP